jgi:hypothetical protein
MAMPLGTVLYLKIFDSRKRAFDSEDIVDETGEAFCRLLRGLTPTIER